MNQQFETLDQILSGIASGETKRIMEGYHIVYTLMSDNSLDRNDIEEGFHNLIDKYLPSLSSDSKKGFKRVFQYLERYDTTRDKPFNLSTRLV